jgi:hypothetical protein
MFSFFVVLFGECFPDFWPIRVGLRGDMLKTYSQCLNSVNTNNRNVLTDKRFLGVSLLGILYWNLLIKAQQNGISNRRTTPNSRQNH